VTAMPAAGHILTRDDILPLETFEAERATRRRELQALKGARRVAVGPFTTFYFECYETMWWQVHEMLRTERGGEAQIADELAAYNPLIPNGRELVATFMIEIGDEVRRTRELARLGGIERAIAFRIGERKIPAVPEDDIERTTADGKTSAVHFLHFPFAPADIAAFRAPEPEITLAIGHPDYRHAAVLPPATVAALARDFD